MLKKILLLPFILFMAGHTALAQVGGEYQLAGFLMNQQKYDEALPILQDMIKDQPGSFPIADRLAECYVQLKQYKDGIDVISGFIKNEEYASTANIRLGELYHFKGDTSEAFRIWENNLNTFGNEIQTYLSTSRTMIERREFEKAIQVFKKGRKNFRNQQLFFGDMANAYMQAGLYDEAVNEWLNFLKEVPSQSGYIQRTLLRYDDPLIYDLTILEIDDFLNSNPVSDDAYQVFYDFQIWLLMENQLYKRALATAREFEEKTSAFTYSLFQLGLKLADNQEFELAIDAFAYYRENSFGEVRWRSLEELGTTYMEWGKFISDYNLSSDIDKNELYERAATVLDQLLNETRNYSRLATVFEKRAEISLDHKFDLTRTRSIERELTELSPEEEPAELFYLRGRIRLAEGEYAQARIELTRANRTVEIGELAEKTRYFLALTDFIAGDYEFSKIQLKTLGRQTTSYYANDALNLRLWIQKGLSEDTTGASLDTFSKAYFLSQTGEKENARDLYYSMLESDEYRVLHEDILVLLPEFDILPPDNFWNTETEERLLGSGSGSLKERLMWETARLADENVTDDDLTLQDVISRYENLILAYPQGFYAGYARDRIQELSRNNTGL